VLDVRARGGSAASKPTRARAPRVDAALERLAAMVDAGAIEVERNRKYAVFTAFVPGDADVLGSSPADGDQPIATKPGVRRTRSSHARTCAELVQREPALVRDVRVREQRDVRDRVLVDEERVRREVAVHHAERGEAAVAAGGDRRVALGTGRLVEEPEARRRDERLVAVLLEEEPLEDERPAPPVVRQERGARARYARIAFDSASTKPSSSRSGVRPFGFMRRNSGVRLSAAQDVDAARSRAAPQLRGAEADLVRVPEIAES
jgi:hypothetical protein